MKPYAVSIPAGSVEEFAVVGDYIRLKTAAVPVSFTVEETGESIELEQGDAANLSAFKRVKVAHKDAAAQAIVFYVGNGTSADSAKVGGSVSVASVPDVKSAPAAYAQTAPVVGVASGQLLAAKADRRFLLVQNKHASQSIWINLAGAAATTAGGVLLAPGASLLLDQAAPNGAINAIGETGDNAAVVVVEG